MGGKNFRTILWFLIASVLVFAPVARGAVRLWAITPVLLLEAVIISAWLWKANNEEGYIFKATPLDKPIMVFSALAILSFIFSVYKHDSFYALIQFFGYIGIYYTIVNEFDYAMRIRLVWLIVITGAILSLYGILQYCGALGHSWWVADGLLAATYVNHNHFAGYLELVIPLAVGLLLYSVSDKKPAWPVLIPAILVMLAAFILTQSRGGWICLPFAFIIMSIILSKKRRISIQTFLIIFLTLFAFAAFLYFARDIVYNRIAVTSAADGGDASAPTRLKIWKGSLGMIMHYPLTGAGIGDFIWAFPRFRPEGLNVHANFAHNDYLQVAAEMGIAALLTALWMLLMLLKTAAVRSRNDPLRAGLAVGILSMSLHGLVDFNFHIPANMILFTICAALVVSRPEKGPED